MSSLPAVVVLVPSTGEVGGAWGSTGAFATRKLHGLTGQTFTIVEQTEAVPMTGYIGASPINDEVARSGEFSLDGVVTYQEMPKMYNAIFTHSSASTAAAAPYDFHWAAPVATTQVCATYAYEFGTTGLPYVAHGGITNSLRISGEAGSNWQFTVGGFAKDIVSLSSGLSTAAFADARSMTPVAMKDTHLRLSPFATGLYGTSSGQVDATLISFELNYNPNRHLKQFAGSVTPGNWGDGRSEGTLRTVLEFNANAKAYVDELVGDAGTVPSTGAMLQRQVQVYASATSTAGTTGFVSAIRFAGAVSSPIPLWGDRNGNLTVDITWGGKFSTAFTPIGSTDGNFLSFQISNNTSSTT